MLYTFILLEIKNMRTKISNVHINFNQRGYISVKYERFGSLPNLEPDINFGGNLTFYEIGKSLGEFK